MYTHIYRIAHEMSYHLIIQFSDFDNEICINSVSILLKINVIYKANAVTFRVSK